MATHDPNFTRAQPQRLGQESTKLIVCPPVDGRAAHPHLQLVTVHPDYARAAGAGYDTNGKDRTVGVGAD